MHTSTRRNETPDMDIDEMVNRAAGDPKRVRQLIDAAHEERERLRLSIFIWRTAAAFGWLALAAIYFLR